MNGKKVHMIVHLGHEVHTQVLQECQVLLVPLVLQDILDLQVPQAQVLVLLVQVLVHQAMDLDLDLAPDLDLARDLARDLVLWEEEEEEEEDFLLEEEEEVCLMACEVDQDLDQDLDLDPGDEVSRLKWNKKFLKICLHDKLAKLLLYADFIFV